MAKKYVRNYVWYKSKILKEINVSNWAKIVFTYLDYNLLNYGSGVNGAFKLLSNFYVSDAANNTIKSVSLNYNYHITGSGFSNCVGCPSSTKRPFLNAITSGADLYSFEYYSPELLPVIASYSQDHWGFYNGKNNGNNFISSEGNPIYFPPEATADRNPDPTYAVSGLLKKIVHPTGGYDELIYEGNVASSGIVGGMRVKTITKNDGVSGSPITRRIYYGTMDNPTVSTGSAAGIILDRNSKNGKVCYYSAGGSPWQELLTCTYQERSSNTVNSLGIYNGGIVAYEYVTESFGGDNFEQGGIEHWFRVTNNYYATPVINGLTYDAPMSISATLHGTEISTKIFKKNGTQKIVLRHITNNYTANPGNFFKEVKSWKVIMYWLYVTGPPYVSDGYDVIKTVYQSYWERLESTVNVEYDQNGQNPMTTTKNYFYNNSGHLQVTKIETTDSQGNILKDEFRYPTDFINEPPANLYTDMVSRNIISPVLEKKSFSNAVLQEQVVLSYKYGFNNMLVPDLVKMATKNNSLETNLTYEHYDILGNPTQLFAADGVKKSFIWDYHNRLVAAEVNNAEYDDICYAGFEADGKGGWDYEGTIYTDGSAPTGKKVYALVTGDVSKRGLSSTTTYIVSYWSKNGPQHVQGNPYTTITGRSVKDWTYYQKKVVNPTGGMITVSGSGVIDELRLYPEMAQMTTFAHQPLVGVTSICDPNNRITYYEYDEYHRLIVIRDMEKRIIKKVCYNYSGQTENCNIYYNVEINQIFTREGCIPPLNGWQINYTIPHGTYISTISQADANAKAWNDIILNGQAYANAMGSCGASPCSVENCSGVNKKCVNDVCETGIRVNIQSRQIDTNLWQCVYRFEWSDGTWSENFTEETTFDCMTQD